MALRRIPTPPNAKRHALASMGDSITFNNVSLYTMPGQNYPDVAVTQLLALGGLVKVRNFGIASNTTTQMLARISAMTLREVPDIATIYGGINDPSNSISAATTQANIQAMVTALKAAGVTRIVVLNIHYYNFATGGDTLSVPLASTQTTRTAIAAAVTAIADPNVVLCDIYSYLRSLIVAGTVTQGNDLAWHVAVGNLHLNAQGHIYVASALVQTIQAQTGWLAAISVP